MEIKRIIFAILIFLSISSGTVLAQSTPETEPPARRYSYLKLTLTPLIGKAIWPSSRIWLILQYESQIKSSKFTYNMVVDVDKYNSSKYDIRLRPQARYYLGKNAYRGVFVGLFPMYVREGGDDWLDYGNYFGGGGTVGYQFFIAKKFPMEFNFFYSAAVGTRHSPSALDHSVIYDDQRDYRYSSIEINIGIPIRKRK